MKERQELVNKEEVMSIRKQCEVLSVNRSGLYYAPVGESEENPEIMRKIDEHYLDHPTEGVLRVQDFLFTLGFVVNHKRVHRLLRLMGLMAIYPLYSRYIVGWGISNSLEAKASTTVMKQAVKNYGKPEMINSDQGSQFTCEDWISYLESEGIEISVDSKGSAIDNIFIERFWRSVKYDYVYLHPAGDGLELYQGLKEYMHYYNYELHHQGIDRKTPAERYQAA
jgi:putative transposase